MAMTCIYSGLECDGCMRCHVKTDDEYEEAGTYDALEDIDEP